MSDQPYSDSLDEQMRALARSFDYPPTPDIERAVRNRFAGKGPAHPAPSRVRLAWIALLVAAGLLLSLAVPEVQAFVRSVLRIGSIEIVNATPTPLLSTPGVPSATPIAKWGSSLVGETTLAQAQALVPFTIQLPQYPTDLGMPERVYAQDIGGPAVILGWLQPGHPDKVRMVLYQLSSDLLGRKTRQETTIVQETEVGGRFATWISGPHLLEIYGPDGKPTLEPRRLVEGNVLVWENGGITYRLESEMQLDEALRVAESLKPPDPQNPIPTATVVAAPGEVGATSIVSSCEPTYQDPPGPYMPGAPVRSSVGKGHILRGTVRSSRDCASIAGAKIELWPSDENDRHDPNMRATIFSDGEGAYYFQCNFPNHIHIRVSAEGYRPLITNAYHPQKGQAEGRFDIVMQTAP